MQPDPGKQRHDEPIPRRDRRGEIQDVSDLPAQPRGLMKLRRILVLADESADWVVAGLRQLDRVALALDEFAVANNAREPMVVCLFWRPDVDPTRRWVPNDSRLTHLAFTTNAEDAGYDLVLSTRLFLYRKAIDKLIEEAAEPFKSGVSWDNCFERVK